MSDLKMCPVCGNEDIFLSSAINSCWVMCDDCGTCSKRCDSPDEAEKSWNELPERDRGKPDDDYSKVYILLQRYRNKARNAIIERDWLAKQCPMTDTDIASEQIEKWLERASEARHKMQADKRNVR